jgi:hypothetical protein
MIPVRLLSLELEEEEDHCLLLVLLAICRRDGISHVLRLRVLERRSRGRMMFGREVQDMLLGLVVGEVVL